MLGEDAKRAMGVLLDKFRPLFAPGPEMAHPGAELGMMRTLNIPRISAKSELGLPSSAAAVYVIALDTMTGRAETVPTV